MMPGMDGWAVLTALKADPELADIPVIMLTIVDDQNLGYALGAADYLTKPMRPADRCSRRVARHASHRRRSWSSRTTPAPRECCVACSNAPSWTVGGGERPGRPRLDGAGAARRLLLLDLMMPEMDGFTFIERMRARHEWAAIPVIVCTAKDLTEDDRRRLAGGVVQIIGKDLGQLETLGAAIAERLQDPTSQERCGVVHLQPPWTCGRFEQL